MALVVELIPIIAEAVAVGGEATTVETEAAAGDAIPSKRRPCGDSKVQPAV